MATCLYCGAQVSNYARKCPNCGAPIESKAPASGMHEIPRTIAELKDFCVLQKKRQKARGFNRVDECRLNGKGFVKNFIKTPSESCFVCVLYTHERL